MGKDDITASGNALPSADVFAIESDGAVATVAGLSSTGPSTCDNTGASGAARAAVTVGCDAITKFLLRPSTPPDARFVPGRAQELPEEEELDVRSPHQVSALLQFPFLRRYLSRHCASRRCSTPVIPVKTYSFYRDAQLRGHASL